MTGRFVCSLPFWPIPSGQCSSIKVYLSAVRALHIDQGFPDPLQNCHRLRRVIRGIKRSQGSPSSTRLPITDSLMLVIWRSLDMHIPDHCMFWAACTLGYLGFLRAAEFTVPSLASFSPLVHLTVLDIAVDTPSSPSCMRVKIKASTTDPFRKGSDIHIGLGRQPFFLCCAGHDGLSFSKRQFSRAFVLPSGWSNSFSWPSHSVAKADHGCRWYCWELFEP